MQAWPEDEDGGRHIVAAIAAFERDNKSEAAVRRSKPSSLGLAMESAMSTYLVGRGDNERTVNVRRIADTAAGGIRYGITIDDGEESPKSMRFGRSTMSSRWSTRERAASRSSRRMTASRWRSSVSAAST